MSQLDGLVDNAPQYAADVSDFVKNNDTLSGLEEKYDLTGKLQDEAEQLPSKIGDAAGVVRDLGVGIVNSIFAAVTILILSIFMVGGNRRWINGLLEPSRRNAPSGSAAPSTGSAPRSGTTWAARSSRR